MYKSRRGYQFGYQLWKLQPQLIYYFRATRDRIILHCSAVLLKDNDINMADSFIISGQLEIESFCIALSSCSKIMI
jgi:hypothetical protein